MRFRPLFLVVALFLLIHGTAFADGGNIMGDVYVDGQAASGMCVDVFDSYGNGAASQLTTGDGDYNIYIAQPGNYTVRVSDCGAGYTTTQWYPNASNQWDAQVVQIISDQDSPNVNGYLSSAGRVTGNVKDNLNAVTTGACVKAEAYNGDVIAETTTDGNGNYALGGLPAGDVRMRFEGCSSGNYVLEYYDNALDPADATLLTVQSGETQSGIDAVLTQAGKIAGHIQNADGDPLQNICISGSAGGAELAGTVTDSNGNYEIRGVPPTGSYDLGAWDCYGSTYMGVNKTGPVAGTGTASADFTLQRPGFITGHVRDDAGAGLASICVTASNAADGDEAVAQTDRNGYYELNQLRPGTWDLSFNAAI